MTDPDRTANLHDRAEEIRRDMGGADKVARMAEEGDKTVRQHIDAFVDDGTFREIGTFSHSERPDVRDTTPGDGKIGGHANVGDHRDLPQRSSAQRLRFGDRRRRRALFLHRRPRYCRRSVPN